MEIFFKRFPLASKMILRNLDNQSLVRSKEVSSEVSEILCKERFYWIRIIAKHVENFEEYHESWIEVINKTPANVVKQLAIAVEEFFKSYTFDKLAPLHIAAEKGSLQLCEYIIAKTSNKNPEGNVYIGFSGSETSMKFKIDQVMID